MQVISLKPGFEEVINSDVLNKITTENDYICLEDNLLYINFDLDQWHIKLNSNAFGEDEDEIGEFLEEFEDSFSKLANYFNEEFEIFYFTYSDEYTATMWKFHSGVLMKSSGWIGDFCNSCKSIEDEDEKEVARNGFVDENTDDLRNGSPSDELLAGLRENLSTEFF